MVVPARRDGAWQLFLLDTAQPGVRFEAQLTTALEPRARVHLDAVAATAPVVTTQPSITGAVSAGSTLTAVNGAASGSPTPTASRADRR